MRGSRGLLPLVALGSLLLSLCAAEGLARVYVNFVVKQGKLFQADPVLGWRLLPDLDLERTNPDGKPWQIRTDASGVRGPSSWRKGASGRVLVVGDSFAFGQGVQLAERFDRLLEADNPEWSFVNLGVMGYGTDQQVIAARPYLADMRPGDLVLLVTYSNDFIDVLRRYFSGRAKPYFELTDEGVVEHPPRVGWLEVLRDRSYIWARVASLLEKTRRYPFSDVRNGVELYDAILRHEAWRWGAAGLKVVIAYHGLGNARQENELRFMAGSMGNICARPRLNCVALDAVLARHECEGCFLGDGHWSARGHRAVADAIDPRVRTVLGSGTRRP